MATMSFRHVGWEWPLVLLIALVAGPLFAARADAATSSCGAYWSSGKFVGNLYNPTNAYVRGSAADIEIEQPALCSVTDGDAWVATWAMVARDNDPGWAQIGYEYRNYAPTRYFWQWYRGPGYGLNYAYWGTPAVNTTHNFKVSRYQTDGKLHMLLDNNVPTCAGSGGFGCPVTDFDPTQAWYGLQGQYFAETRWSGNDVPGVTNDEADFFNVKNRNGDGTWTSNGFTSSAAPSYCFWHRRTNSPSNFEIWTAPINHNC